MGIARFVCPSTYNEVTTTIETGHDTLFRMKKMNLKIWVWCPHCTPGHQISPSDAIITQQAAVADSSVTER